MPDGHRLPLKSARTVARRSSRAPTWEPSQRKPRTNVGAGFRAWCFWGSFLPALVLVGSFCSSLFFPFRATSQGPIISGLRPRGVTCQVPDGRDVGSEQGHRPKNWYFQVSHTCNGLVRVHLGLSLRHCAVSWFRQDVTLQQNQYDDEFFNLGCMCDHVYLIARSAEANHHDHRGPASRFYRPRFRGAAVTEVLLLAVIVRIPHRSYCPVVLQREASIVFALLVSSSRQDISVCGQCNWRHTGSTLVAQEAMCEVHLIFLDLEHG